MFQWYLVRLLLGNIIGSVFFVSFLLIQIVAADLEALSLQYIARRLLPNECQILITHEVGERKNDNFYLCTNKMISAILLKSYESAPSNAVDCFRNLVDWASNLRMNRRDTHLMLGNRLHEIGRDDLAAWLVGPSSGGRGVTEETVEYDSWNSIKKERDKKLVSSSVPTISKLNTLIYGPFQPKSIIGLSREFQQQSISSFPNIRKLTGIHNRDMLKNRYFVMADPQSGHPVASVPINVTVEPKLQNQTHGESGGTISTTTKINDVKDLKSSQTVGGKTSDDKIYNKLKFPRIISQFSDEKTAQCLRVPLSTALVVIGTIMILTCCCALLLRNRLVACFERFRRKKPPKPISKRMSTDEEQGFMGPRTVGKPPKRSGRKGGGPVDMTNVGVQNPNAAGESEEKLTGCCNCCAKKKKKNRKKWKK